VLPFEQVGMDNIKQAFSEDFAFLEELLRLGLEALGWGAGHQGQGRLRFVSPIRGLRMDGLRLILGLFAKSSKQLRAIMVLCERGLTSDAETIARNLFESLLAIQFLLKPRLTLLENGKRIQPDKKKPLARSFRASLYDAHLIFQHTRRIARFRKTPRLKRLARHLGDPATFDKMS